MELTILRHISLIFLGDQVEKISHWCAISNDGAPKGKQSHAQENVVKMLAGKETLTYDLANKTHKKID